MPEPLKGKYLVSRPGGEPIEDQDAFFVLKIATDSVARVAAREYARHIYRANPALASSIIKRCDYYDGQLHDARFAADAARRTNGNGHGGMK